MPESEPVMIDPLVADIITAMTTETHNVTNRVIDGLMDDIRELKAWKEIVTGRILHLVDKPYTASPRLFEEALYVDAVLIRLSAVNQKVYDFPGSKH